jgi:hypothetical protein
MKEYVSTVVIDASPEITRIDGRLALGATVRAHVRLGSGAVRAVPQRIVAFSPPDRMEWVGGLPLGLFVGRRIYTVTPRSTGAEFRLHVQMSGLLAPLILKSVGDRQPELDRFSQALKGRVERSLLA